MKTQHLKQIIKEELEKILNEAGFNFRPQKGGVGGRRFIPKTFTFPGRIREELKDYFKYFGNIMYVDPQVLIALGYLERGRQSYDKTQNFPSLTKLLQDKLPQQVRLAIKKGAEGQKMVDVAGKKMVPLNLEIIKDNSGDYLIKNPYFGDSIEEYENMLNEILVLEKKSSSTIYKFKGLLSVETRKRNKEEVLSDIRSLTGVTIVSTKPAQGENITPNTEESVLSIKVDPHPYLGKGGFSKEKVEEIIKDIRKIDGVDYFKLIVNI